MRDLKKNLLPFVIISLTFFSCLDPQGDNFVELPQPGATPITLDLANLGNDTILIDEITRFIYQVNGYPLYITDIEVTLNEYSPYLTPNSDNAFIINPLVLKSGFYKMWVRLAGITNNGSLADRLGKERILVSKEFNVVIDSDPPTTARIVKIDTTQGRLSIFWNRYSKQNFGSYKVVKYCYDNNNYTGAICKEVTITDASDTSWTDEEYVGGRVKYWVETYSTLLWDPGTEVEYWWKPRFTSTAENGMVTLHWSKPPFYKNIKKILLESLQPFPIEVPIADTTFTSPDPLIFGRSYNLNLNIISANEYRPAEFSVEHFAGDRFSYPAVMPHFYNTKEQLYYGPGDNSNTVVMDRDMNVIHNHSGLLNMKISENGEHFITLKENIFYRADPKTLTTTFLVEAFDSDVQYFTVTNNGLIGYQCETGYKVIDILTGELKFSSPQGTTSARPLSPSGNFLVDFARQVFRYDGNSFVYRGTLPLDFDPGEGLKFIDNDNIINRSFANGMTTMIISEYDINTLNALYSIPISGLNMAWIGLSSDKKNMLVEIDGLCYFLNRESREIKNAPQLVAGSVIQLDGRLFSSSNNYVYSVNISYIE